VQNLKFLTQSIQEVAEKLPNGELVWKRKDLEKVLEDLSTFDIAIISGEALLMERSKAEALIQLKSGKIDIFNWKFVPEPDEEWLSFVLRTSKSSLEIINRWNLEKEVSPHLASDLYYHLDFVSEDDYSF
jgi:hypothetical protein